MGLGSSSSATVSEPKSSSRLAVPLDELKFLDGDTQSHDQFIQDLRELGYSVFRLSEETENQLRNYEEDCKSFFELDKQEKEFWRAKPEDALLESMGRRPNMGYIATHPKEYLKLRNSDGEAVIPPSLRGVFKDAQGKLQRLGDSCMVVIGSYKVNDQQGSFMTDEILTSARSLVEDGASVSSIHYFTSEQQKNNTAAAALASGDPEYESKVAGDLTDGERLGIHQDTGILTFIRSAKQPGLQILDRNSGDYFTSEEKFEPEKHLFCIMGQKIQLLAKQEKIFEATYHRVLFDPTVERFSLLYFMDFKK